MTIKTIDPIIPNIVNSVKALPFRPWVFFFPGTLAKASFPLGIGTPIPPGIEVDTIPRYNDDGCGMITCVNSMLVEERFPGTSGDKTLISDERCGFTLEVDAILVEVTLSTENKSFIDATIAVDEPPPKGDESCGQMLGEGCIEKVVVETVAGVVSLQSVMWPSKKYPLGHLRPHLRFWSEVHSWRTFRRPQSWQGLQLSTPWLLE